MFIFSTIRGRVIPPPPPPVVPRLGRQRATLKGSALSPKALRRAMLAGIRDKAA